MTTGTIVVIIFLAVALIGVLPIWKHSARWGYGPLSMVAVIIAVLVLMRVTAT